MSEEIDPANAQLVGRNGRGEITVMMPCGLMSRQEALVHAAWLVALADRRRRVRRLPDGGAEHVSEIFPGTTPATAAVSPYEAAERCWRDTGDWEMTVEVALAAQRQQDAATPAETPAAAGTVTGAPGQARSAIVGDLGIEMQYLMRGRATMCSGCTAEWDPDAQVVVHENNCPRLVIIRADSEGIPCTAKSAGFCNCPRHEATAAIAAAPQPAPGDVELLKRAADALAEFGKIAITVEHWLDKPYEDDPRWSPWTRWVERPAREAHDLAMVIRKRLKAAPVPQAAPGLREALAELVTDWREGSKYRVTDTRDEINEGLAVNGCANALAAVLEQHPEAQPAPELAAAMREARLMRERFARFADGLEAEADEDDSAREGQPDGVARLLLQRTRDLRRLIARDMRSAAGLEAK